MVAILSTENHLPSSFFQILLSWLFVCSLRKRSGNLVLFFWHLPTVLLLPVWESTLPAMVCGTMLLLPLQSISAGNVVGPPQQGIIWRSLLFCLCRVVYVCTPMEGAADAWRGQEDSLRKCRFRSEFFQLYFVAIWKLEKWCLSLSQVWKAVLYQFSSVAAWTTSRFTCKWGLQLLNEIVSLQILLIKHKGARYKPGYSKIYHDKNRSHAQNPCSSSTSRRLVSCFLQLYQMRLTPPATEKQWSRSFQVCIVTHCRLVCHRVLKERRNIPKALTNSTYRSTNERERRPAA